MTDPQTAQADAQDMARLVAGNDAALSALMERHAQRLFNYLLRQLNNEADASEIAQETFVRVYHHRARFRPERNFTTWLYTIATNLLRSHFRWRQRHPQVSLDAQRDETTGNLKEMLPDSAPSPSDHTQREERAAQVREAVASLPEELRIPLVLAEYDELPHAQIAAILNCTPKAVEMRLYRARGLLRQRLQRFFN